MKTQPWWLWATGGLVVVALIVGGVLIGRATAPSTPTGGQGSTPPVTEPTSTVETQTPPVSPDEPGDGGAGPQYVRVYFSRGEYLGVAMREVPATKAVATAAMEQLLAGPNAAETGWGLSTQIPAGTRLLGLTIADGTARVDLSGGFDSGGGTLSMTMRLAQVAFTLTQFPTVERVVFMMDGAVVDVFGGEGIMLDRPQTRADFEYVLPAIFVESPVPGATVSSPIRLQGTGNTFEAAFMIRLENASGGAIVEKPAMATSGTGTRGTFDVTLTFPDAAPNGPATLVVYESSAKDGSEINIVRIPVTIAR